MCKTVVKSKQTAWCGVGLFVVACAALGPAAAADGPANSPATSLTAPEPTASPPKSAKERRPQRYQFRSRHDPDGIGKFYLGREIAHVMGYLGIDWLERPERESEEHLTQLVDSLKLKPGMVVADIGAGSGVISLMMAKKVGPTGSVLAVDIQDEMLSVLSKRLKQLKITNVRPVHGTVKSPNLKPGSVDLALMVDVYHEFNFPYEMLREIAKALKPGGRVVFVEYRKEDPNVPIKLVHKMTEAQVKLEAGQPEFGLRWVETIGVLPRQHVIVFERRQ
jgi:ubiquinone/menaquinone biosynthesis C-methylase UbiE